MMYKCPFCRIEIQENIDALRLHRKPDGECDKAMKEIEDER